jgi:hypothetical protein
MTHEEVKTELAELLRPFYDKVDAEAAATGTTREAIVDRWWMTIDAALTNLGPVDFGPKIETKWDPVTKRIESTFKYWDSRMHYREDS